MPLFVMSLRQGVATAITLTYSPTVATQPLSVKGPLSGCSWSLCIPPSQQPVRALLLLTPDCSNSRCAADSPPPLPSCPRSSPSKALALLSERETPAGLLPSRPLLLPPSGPLSNPSTGETFPFRSRPACPMLPALDAGNAQVAQLLEPLGPASLPPRVSASTALFALPPVLAERNGLLWCCRCLGTEVGLLERLAPNGDAW
mmetsp:Transcript_5744/g.15340  ORF Transcript_5744/g.15340 Transcript_5744/m.15340 type:complete len:202 (-) Transcript_5744:492-1097(-)